MEGMEIFTIHKMKLPADTIEGIVEILDPMCHLRYREGECLPRGMEGTGHDHANQVQEFRERSARNKAARIIRFIEENT
jgi:hypothetical protein